MKQPIATTLLALTLFATGYASPKGMRVESGRAIHSISGKNHQIDVSTNKAILNWDQFSVNRGEKVNFALPSSKSAVLNRDFSGSRSEIRGALESNGHIYLINKQGVCISREGTVTSAGFLASTADIENGSFLSNGEHQFVNPEGMVQVVGKIDSLEGNVTLIGRSVENSGKIIAKNGSVNLVSGEEVFVNVSGNGGVYIKPETDDGKGYSITNEGEIEAVKTRIISEGSPYKLAIKNSGTLSGFAVAEEDGEVIISSNRGRVEAGGVVAATANGKKGGIITIIGEEVILPDHAKIDASGELGGGNINIGKVDGKSARLTWASESSLIHADALDSGDGGNVLFWGDEAALHNGFITARGGNRGGDGGFIEVSSPKSLQIAGNVDLTAPKGSLGRYLIDPSDVYIVDDGNGGYQRIQSAPPFGYNLTANQVKLNVNKLKDDLSRGDVVIDTSRSLQSNNAEGSIYVEAKVDWSGEGSLSLVANKEIVVRNMINGFSSKEISLNAPTVLIGDGTQSVSVGINAYRVSEDGTDGGVIRITAPKKFEMHGASIKPAVPQPAVPLDSDSLHAGTHIIRKPGYAQLSSSYGKVIINAGNVRILGGSDYFDFARINTLIGDIVVKSDLDIIIRGHNDKLFENKDLNEKFGNNGIEVANYSLADRVGNVMLTAGRHVRIGNEGRVINGNATGKIVIVTDNIHPKSPSYGTGMFEIASRGELGSGPSYFSEGEDPSAGRCDIYVYTSLRGYNKVPEGIVINRTPYHSGTIQVNTSHEKWGDYFPTGEFGGDGFTFFYKGSPVQPTMQPKIEADISDSSLFYLLNKLVDLGLGAFETTNGVITSFYFVD